MGGGADELIRSDVCFLSDQSLIAHVILPFGCRLGLSNVPRRHSPLNNRTENTMKLLVAIALVLAPAAPSVSARAFCANGDVAVTSSYTAGAHDEFVTVTATANGARTSLGRRVFVRRRTTYTVTADTGQHDAPNGVRVHWSGFSTQRSLPWSVVWRTPSIACSP